MAFTILQVQTLRLLWASRQIKKEQEIHENDGPFFDVLSSDQQGGCLTTFLSVCQIGQ